MIPSWHWKQNFSTHRHVFGSWRVFLYKTQTINPPGKECFMFYFRCEQPFNDMQNCSSSVLWCFIVCFTKSEAPTKELPIRCSQQIANQTVNKLHQLWFQFRAFDFENRFAWMSQLKRKNVCSVYDLEFSWLANWTWLESIRFFAVSVVAVIDRNF